MPRTVQELLAHADELADRFENWEPDPSRVKDTAPLRDVHKAFQRVAAAEEELLDAVITARAHGFSWAMIGNMLGTTGEAARQRYGGQSSSLPGRA
jgi:hypothetical protein